MIKFNNKTCNAINSWFEKNDFDLICKIGEDLEYYLEENIITIPKTYDDSMDCYFMKWLRQHGLTTDFDCLVLSILHEIGHFETENLFTYQEWENDNAFKVALQFTNLEDEEFYFSYWDSPTEYVANMWLITYANIFMTKCQDLEDLIFDNCKEL